MSSVFPTQPSFQLLDQLTDLHETLYECCPWNHVDCLQPNITITLFHTISNKNVAGVGTCEAEIWHCEQTHVLWVYHQKQQQQ
jgi:hypothetical protein